MAGVENTNSSTAAAVSPVARTGSPPWTQIVGIAPSAGDQSALESCDDNAGNKKPAAWSKKPSPESEGGAVVMGAELWPALSESTKASPKLSPSNSSMNLPDLGSPSAPPPPVWCPDPALFCVQLVCYSAFFAFSFDLFSVGFDFVYKF